MFGIFNGSSVDEVVSEELEQALALPRGRSFVDVREDHEWAEAHVDGFTHHPLGSLLEHLEELDPSQTYFLLCASGGRSVRACKALKSHGLRAVNVRGGIRAWIQSGRPVVAGSST